MSTQTQTLRIDGMHCDHCVEAVEEALSDVEGVTVLGVEVGTAEVTYDPVQVSEDQLVAAIDDAGYDIAV